uniref:Homeobox domain-containing protein n=1 Tax=Rhabditophanes sp. KR3021 TaxID=114890 RepID=A0AC35UDI9_9BILA
MSSTDNQRKGNRYDSRPNTHFEDIQSYDSGDDIPSHHTKNHHSMNVSMYSDHSVEDSDNEGHEQMEDEDDICRDQEEIRNAQHLPILSLSPIKDNDRHAIAVPTMDSLTRQSSLGSRLNKNKHTEEEEIDLVYECTKLYLNSPEEMKKKIGEYNLPNSKEMLDKTFKPT